ESMRPKRYDGFQQQAAHEHDVNAARNSLVNRPAGDLHKLLKLRCQEGSLDPQLEGAVLMRLRNGNIRPKSLYHILEAKGSDFERVKQAIWQMLEVQPAGLATSLFEIINAEAGPNRYLARYEQEGNNQFYWTASIEKDGKTLQT